MSEKVQISYLAYARDLLDKFVAPIIDDVRHDSHSNNYNGIIPIQIVFPTEKLEHTKYDDGDGYSIFTIFDNSNNLDALYDLDGDDKFGLNLPSDILGGWSFCFSHEDEYPDTYVDESWERIFSYEMGYPFDEEDYDTSYSPDGNQLVLSKFPEPSSFEDMEGIVNVLKQLMVERYATVDDIDVFTLEQFRVFQAKTLKQRLGDFCKYYHINKQDLI